MQYPEHPIVLALNAVVPVVLPSFTLYSGRDNGKKPAFPMLGYVIVNTQNETYDASTRKFKGTIQVQIEALLKEPKDEREFDWCQYSELQHNQNKQALMYDLEQKLKQILLFIVHPNQAANKDTIKLDKYDSIFEKYEFGNLNISVSEYRNRVDSNLTGAVVLFTMSYVSDRIACCILNDTDKQQLEALKGVFNKDSVTEQIIQKQLDQLNNVLPLEDLHLRINAMDGVNGGSVSDGDVVNTVEDWTSNGFDFITSANPVIWRASRQNGQPAFETRSSYLQNTSFSIAPVDEISIFIVLQREEPNTGVYGSAFIISTSYSTPGSNFLQLNEGISPNYAVNFSQNALDKQLTPATNDAIIVNIVKTPTSATYYVNGVDLGTNLGIQDINNPSIFLGSFLNNHFQGLFYELIIYKGAMTEVKRQTVTQYLQITYGI